MSSKSKGLDSVLSSPGAMPGEQDSQQVTMEKALDELFSKKQIELKSDISQRQVIALARGLIFAKKYKSKNMEGLINNILELSVSKKRKGRQEFVKVVQSGNNNQDQEDVSKLKDKLLR